MKGPNSKSNPHLIPFTTINSKWVKDLNIGVKTIKILEENLCVNLHDLGLRQQFLRFDT